MTGLQASCCCWSAFTRSTSISTSSWTPHLYIYYYLYTFVCTPRSEVIRPSYVRLTIIHADSHTHTHARARARGRARGSRDSSVGTVTRLRNGRPRIVVLLLADPKDLSLFQRVQTFSRTHLASCPLRRGKGNRSGKLTTHPTYCRAVPPLFVCLHGVHKWDFILHLHRLMHAECNNRSTQNNCMEKRITDCRSRSLALLVHCCGPIVTLGAASYRGGFA
jgi:hypothetical protein